MDFSQRVRELANRSKHASRSATTEEATKTAVVLPLIQMLGFDVFNLDEVIPEFVADVGIKKGEKIDFALKIDGKVAILIEAKPINMPLGDAQYNQLYRYFAAAEARLAILTNGREVWFFSDTDERNKMDKRPFFVFDLQSYDEHQVAELSRFQKSGFAIDSILEAASNLKYVKSAAAFLKAQLNDPDDEFVRQIGRHIYEGSITKGVLEQLRPAVRASLDEVVRDRIQDRLSVTLRPEASAADGQANKPPGDPQAPAEIETTQDELQAFMIVRAIGARVVPIQRIAIRDAKSYCGILMDDNNRKPICRLYFNGRRSKSVGFFNGDKNEEKVPIDSVDEIFKYEDKITSCLKAFVAEA